MATAGIIEGTNVIMKVGGTAVSHTTSNSVSLTKSTRDITTKDSGENEEHAAMRNGGSFTLDGMVADDATYGYSEIYAAIKAGTAVALTWGTFVVGDLEYSQSVIINSLDRDDPLDANSTFSVSGIFTGATTETTTT